MTWRDIAASEVAAGASVTTSLMEALRSNLPSAAAQESGAPGVTGWMRRQEVIKSASGTVAAVEFTTDISVYKEVCIDFAASNTAAVQTVVEVRETGGSWRRIAETCDLSGTNNAIMFRCWVTNIDDGLEPGTPLVLAFGMSRGDTGSLTASTPRQMNDQTGCMAGVDDSTGVAVNEIRILPISGSFTGLIVGVLYGIRAIENEATV